MSSKTITVSAPANVMLMGEHAVLFGYRAIVCALSQRMVVTLTPRDDDGVMIYSALGDVNAKLSDILTAETAPQPLAFVLACIRAVKPVQGFVLRIESEFSHTVGLGSSACVTAASVYALLLYRDGTATSADVFSLGLEVIHSVQGRGSGSDLVASVYGGMTAYTQHPRSIKPLLQTDAFSQQNAPRLDLYYCGYKTPTPVVIAKVAEASQQFPRLYDSLYQQMHEVTVAAEQAINDHDWQQLGKLMNIYHGLLDALGVSDAKLSELVYATRQQMGVFGAKISGSGLGDCIISLSASDSAPLTADDAIGATISPHGLRLHD